MNYEDYKDRFRRQALYEGKTEEYIESCLNYAKTILDFGLPVIYDSKHLSKLVGYKQEYLKRAVKYPEAFYWRYNIKKKSGGTREIREPMPILKDIQLWILNHILNRVVCHPYAKAYVRGKNIRHNIRFHTKQEWVLTMDIHDFFGSITQTSVTDIFRGLGYSDWVADLLAKLCCLNGKLPQGAPISPSLSNIYMHDFDDEMKNFCREYHVMYTRYADDLTFSGSFDAEKIKSKVRELLSARRLLVNEAKTHLMHKSQRQIVTGCVVNQRTRLPQSELKWIRQVVFYIKKYGFESHLRHINEKRKNYFSYLYGKVNYALMVQPGNKEMQEYKKFLYEHRNEWKDLCIN
jgi:RNA-directed DNA polymerase